MKALTARQRQVLTLAANGNTNTAIARWLDVSRPTIDRTLNRIYRALGASDRTQAVAIALATGDLTVKDIHIPGKDAA